MRVLRPGQRRPAVRQLGLDPHGPFRRFEPVVVRHASFGQREEIGRVRRPRRFLVSVRGEQFQPVFADRLQHEIARLLSHAGHGAQQVRLDQRAHPFESVLARRVQGEAADKDREEPEKPLLLLRQQIDRPGDRVAHRFLPIRSVAGAGGQQRQPLLQPGQQGNGRQHVDPGGGQFDRQRQAVEAAADRGGRGRVNGQIRVLGERAGGEERDRRGGAQRRLGWLLGLSGHRQRRDGDHLFAGEAQPRPAGRQYRQRRADGKEIGDQWRGVDHLLEVVQHEQNPPSAQEGAQPLHDRRLAAFDHAERPRDRRPDLGGIADRRE